MTKKTGRAAYLCYTRRETFTNGSPRHQIQMRVPIGVDRDGTINATDLHALSNAGAYGGHAGDFAVESAVNGLAAGAASARLGAYLYFFVCDQPYMTEAHLRSFWEEFYKSGKSMGRMRTGARFGSPTIFAPQFRPALMALTGDEGGRRIFAGREGEIYYHDAAPEVLLDFDRPWANRGDA